MMKIKVLHAETLGKVNEINLDLVTSANSEYIVGRSPTSGLVLDSADVSRIHGKFFLQDESYYYSDLGSINGSLFNDKVADINQIYQIKSRDVIRIGEFLLVIEEESKKPEVLSATVFNPNWQAAAMLSTPDTANQAESAVPSVIPQASAASAVPELVTIESEQIIPTSEDLQSPDLTIIQSSQEVEASQTNIPTPIAPSLEEIVPEIKSEIPTEIKSDEVPIAPSLEETTPEINTEISAEIKSNQLTVIQVDATVIQLPEVEASQTNTLTPITPSVEEIIPEINTEIPAEISSSELTVIQVEATVIQLPEVEAPQTNTSTPIAHSLEEIIPEINTESPAEIKSDEVTSLRAEDQDAIAPAPELATTTPETLHLEHDAIAPAPELATTTPETLHLEHDAIAPAPELATTTPETLHLEHDAIAPAPELATITPETLQTEGILVEGEQQLPASSDTVSKTEITLPEPVTQTSEETMSPDSTQTPNEVESEVKTQTPETASKAFEIVSKKYIALMAHDSKKSDIVQFVAQHQDFLSKCLTIATPSISESLYQQTGLATSQKTPLVPVGGYQAVASLIGTGEVLAVILLRDFLVAQSGQANEEALLRICNINQVLVATNMVTAEAIMHYIRDMVTSL